MPDKWKAYSVVNYPYIKSITMRHMLRICYVSDVKSSHFKHGKKKSNGRPCISILIAIEILVRKTVLIIADVEVVVLVVVIAIDVAVIVVLAVVKLK